MKKISKLYLNGEELDYSGKETHLGIERCEDGRVTETVKSRITKARRMSYSLMGAGMHGLNGINPEVSISMINTYVIPALMYGLETLRLGTSNFKELTTFHLKLLKNILHLPKSTSSAAVYLMTGSLPVEAMHHRNALNLFGSCLLRTDSTEKLLIQRQLAMKDMDSNSWVVSIRKMLYNYSLPSAFNLVVNPMPKAKWKAAVKNAINNYWLDTLIKEAEEKSSLKYFCAKASKIGEVHPVWHCGSIPQDIIQATTKARMLVQRYGVAASHTSGRKFQTECPLCKEEPETLEHMLLHCKALETTRTWKMKKITALLEQHEITTTDENLMQAILDTSTMDRIPSAVKCQINIISRRLCHDLHSNRGLGMLTNDDGYRGSPPEI